MYIISYYVSPKCVLHYIIWKFVKTKYKYIYNTWSDENTIKSFYGVAYMKCAPAPNVGDIKKSIKIKSKTKEDVINEMVILHLQYGGEFKGIEYL